jgi:ribonuclease HI
MIAYIDGAANFGRLGIAVIFDNGEMIRKREAGCYNLEAELKACLYALEYFKAKKTKNNIIFTDNMFVFKIKKMYPIKDYANIILKIKSLLDETKTTLMKVASKKNKADIECKYALWGDI